MKDSKFFLNIDINSVNFPFLEGVLAKGSVTEEDLYPFVDQYADTQITDLLFDVFCQISMTPTAVMTSAVEMYRKETVDGQPVDFKRFLKSMYGIYVTQGIDPFDVWFRRTREKGMTAWLSVRMNDAHCPDEYLCWLHGDIFYEAIKNGWVLGPEYGYFCYCLDYSVPEVRARMLAYIKEQLTRYDVDGLELDFSREWYCFNTKDGKDHASIMNGFLRDVKALVNEIAERRGHEIKILIRLMRDIEQNYTLGFDVATMEKEMLVDYVSISPRWASNDSHMPLKEWQERFPGLTIFAGLEALTRYKWPNRSPEDAYAITAAYTLQYLSEGAPHTYLYNFFSNPLNPPHDYQKLYQTCGSIETLVNQPRRHVVAYQDFAPLGEMGWKPLPAEAKGFTIDISTGPMPKDPDAYLVVGLNEELPTTFAVTVNGVTLKDPRPTEVGTHVGEVNGKVYYTADNEVKGKFYAFPIPASCLTEAKQTVLVTDAAPTTVLNHLELTVGFHVG